MCCFVVGVLLRLCCRGLCYVVYFVVVVYMVCFVVCVFVTSLFGFFACACFF